MLERIQQLLTRLRGDNPVEGLVEFAIIWVAVYLIFRFLRGTRAARMFKGLGVVLIITSLLLVLAPENAFPRIQFLYKGFLGFAAIAMVVIFQPELRRALVRLGEARLFRSTASTMEPVIDQIILAVTYLAKNRIGAIIAIERDVPLGGIIEVGTRLNAEVTAELLQTIFWPGSALHDMGVVIHDSKIAAAGVQFPLAEGEDIAQELGSRHRAALGLSQEADCMVIVVSEETGAISLAERGQLIRKLSPDALRSMLKRGLKQAATPITNPTTDTDDMTTDKDAA
ncbi:MAG: diadenylate cyclase CdaA [Phycisphaeraceae bacterium]